MNAQFENAQHKLLNHALSCLLRFGERLSITFQATNSQKDSVARISTISASESAFCAFHFTDTFFQSFKLDQERGRIDIKLPIRNLQIVLRSQLNRKLQTCEWQLQEDDLENRLIVRLHGSQGSVRTHKLTFEAQPAQYPRHNQTYPNRVVAESKTISLLLDNFVNKGSGEVMMVCTPDHVSLQSKEDEYASERKQNRTLQTVVKVHRSHFSTYDVKQPTALTFALREFRVSSLDGAPPIILTLFQAPISLADHLQCPLELKFGVTGEPLSIHIPMQAMYGHVLLATSAPDEEQLREIEQHAVNHQAGEEAPARAVPNDDEQRTNNIESDREPPASVLPDENVGAGRAVQEAASSMPIVTRNRPSTQSADAGEGDRGPQVSARSNEDADPGRVPRSSSMPFVTQSGPSTQSAVSQGGNIYGSDTQGSADEDSLFRGHDGSTDRDEESCARSGSDDEMPGTQADESNKRARYNPLF